MQWACRDYSEEGGTFNRLTIIESSCANASAPVNPVTSTKTDAKRHNNSMQAAVMQNHAGALLG